MLQNAYKIVVSLVLMNRHNNKRRCDRYIMSVELYVWYIKQGSILRRTGVPKVKAKNIYAIHSRNNKIQDHTLWYYPGKESEYLSRYALTESNSVSH